MVRQGGDEIVVGGDERVAGGAPLVGGAVEVGGELVAVDQPEVVEVGQAPQQVTAARRRALAWCSWTATSTGS